jgi:hypothetical protein
MTLQFFGEAWVRDDNVTFLYDWVSVIPEILLIRWPLVMNYSKKLAISGKGQEKKQTRKDFSKSHELFEFHFLVYGAQ